MSPKEKAEELVGKYFWKAVQTKKQAKQCALIAVDDVLKSNPHSNPLSANSYSTYNYWIEVKQEIEKL